MRGHPHPENHQVPFLPAVWPRTLPPPRLSMVTEGRDVERTAGRLPGWVIGAHAHLTVVLAQPNRNQTRRDVFDLRAADGSGKVSLGLTLEGELPGDDVFI